MKKISNLGTQLSREQAKKIKGGDDYGGGAECTNDGDCGILLIYCPSGSTQWSDGRCYGTPKTCHYGSACQ